jgi:hypothetical protein
MDKYILQIKVAYATIFASFLVFAAVLFAQDAKHKARFLEYDKRAYECVRDQKEFYERELHIADSVIRTKTDTTLSDFVREHNFIEEEKRIQSLE